LVTAEVRTSTPGSGSGKTVLLRRIVEEAALLGIPAIVLDTNNDLARLGDKWPNRPEGYTDEDANKAVEYSKRVEVVIWTPGRSSGKPIALGLLPDFSALADDPDARDQAVEMANATLVPWIGATGASAALKKGVFADALRLFAKEGGKLDDLIELLSDDAVQRKHDLARCTGAQIRPRNDICNAIAEGHRQQDCVQLHDSFLRSHELAGNDRRNARIDGCQGRRR
jgi:hypothetical protein